MSPPWEHALGADSREHNREPRPWAVRSGEGLKGPSLWSLALGDVRAMNGPWRTDPALGWESELNF